MAVSGVKRSKSATVSLTNLDSTPRVAQRPTRGSSLLTRFCFLVSTYFAYPENATSTDNAILLLSDVLGQKFINTRLLADHFARCGYLTVVPDLFEGDTVPLVRPEGFQIMEWVKNHMPAQVNPIIETVLRELREKHDVKWIGGVGYCFGGKYIARHRKPGTIDVGYATWSACSYVD